ncbi:MAG: methionyl-tRNA formyltransferase [Alphaproteobacteria bacterium]|nr:methionyl-tRNA formyltransferase [Alphaproteobacteria bacterium]MBP3687613.1 methionyl-tRNA formyltransferase [Alphaproteobacteria bacterium]
MKLIFMGTPDFAVPVLEKLIAEHEVLAVYTRAPKQSGRGKKVNKTPAHLLAEEHGIKVFTPKSLKPVEEQETLRAFGADMAVVAAYGLLLPQAVLDMFPLGCVNVHASLLPRWRGAAPIQRAIESGDKQSGISIMKMALALDAGDVLSQQAVTITPEMTGGELHDALATIGAELLADTLKRFKEIQPIKQDESLVTYAEKLDKAECLLDFQMPTEQLLLKIRAFCPYPALYFIYKGERFKVFKAQKAALSGRAGEILEGTQKLIIATNDGALEILKLQREGKQAMKIAELLRGFSFDKGYLLQN